MKSKKRGDISSRLESLDILKAVAIILMVLIHFIILFLKGHSSQYPVTSIINISASVCAPIFLFVAGIALAISVDKMKEKGAARKDIAKKVLKRAAFLFFGGLLLFNVWNFDILHHIGLFLIFAYLIIDLNWKIKLGIAAIIIAVSEWMQQNFYYLQMWVKGGWNHKYFASMWSLKGFLYNNFLNGWYPFIPWFVFMLAGTIIGRIIINSIRENKEKTLIKNLSYISIGLFCIIPLISLFYDSADKRFPSLADIAIQLGIMIALLAFFYWLLDHRKQALSYFSPFSFIGKKSLKIYVIHILFGACIVWVSDYLGSPLFDRLSPAPVIILSIAFMLLYGIIDYSLTRKTSSQ